jgi:VCBS repeat-containing protein
MVAHCNSIKFKRLAKFLLFSVCSFILLGCTSLSEKVPPSQSSSSHINPKDKEKFPPTELSEFEKKKLKKDVKKKVTLAREKVILLAKDKNVITRYKGRYGYLEIDSTGSWSYKLDENNKTVRALPANAMLVDTVGVSSKDGTIKQIKVSIKGRNDTPYFSGQSDGNGKRGQQDKN